MARPEYVKTLISGLDTLSKRVFGDVFEYVLGNLRFGRPDIATRAENAQLYYFEATTPTVVGTEFSVQHNMGRSPYLLIPCLNLQVVGAKMIRLTVTRLPDTRRVYLSSPDADATIGFWLEG
jgi:hypothetical protein